MLQDLRHAARSLRHAGALPVVAILTLAIGIGGVAAMFTIVNRVVLNPLPFMAQDRLVLVWGSKPQDNQPELPFSQPDFDDLRAQARAFDAIGGWAPGRGNLTGSGDAEQVQWAVVTASLFDVLGVSPAIGRSFQVQEDRPGTPPVAVISHTLWQRRFQSAPDIVGRTLVLDNRAIEIVGVLPADFSFLTFPSKTDVWIPLGADPFDGRRFARGARSMGVLGRLRPGIELAGARAEADTIAAGLATAYPFFNTGRRFALVPLGEQVARDVRSGALALFGAVACVLFIACANVSSLMLARATGQHRDFLIRAALGASRWRLLRLQLAESLLISTAGGAGGLLLAVWLVEVLVRLPYRSDSLYVPYAVARETIGVDLAALAFTMAVTVGSAILFSLAPALRQRHPRHELGHGDVLRAGTRATADRPQRRLRAMLVVAEVALAVVLLVSAGLMTRSLIRLQNVDPGFSPAGVLSLQVTLSRSAYSSPARQAAFYTEALARLRALPGVTGAAASDYVPFTGPDGRTGFYIEGRPAPERGDQQQVHSRGISSDYFTVMGIPLATGRGFTTDDRADGLKVAIVNETMARMCWPGENPVGRRLALDFETLRFFPDRPPERNIPGGMREIVGVVKDIRSSSLQAQPVPEMYTPYIQRSVTDMTLIARTDGDPLGLAAPVRDLVRSIDPSQPVGHIETVSSLLASSIAQPRAHSALLSVFAAVALMLAMIGVFGLLAYDVAQRTRELGIRLALGGQPRDLRALILKNGLQLVGAGLLLGMPAAILAGTWLHSVLFQVSPADPVTLITSAGTLVVVSLVACGIPARRATRIDPMVALRTE
jgi:putative ABC transport system permease protein